MPMATLRCDQAFCFSCVRAYRNDHLPSTSSLEKSFKSTGFNCWKEVYNYKVLKFTNSLQTTNIGDKYLGLNLRKMIVVWELSGIDKRNNQVMNINEPPQLSTPSGGSELISPVFARDTRGFRALRRVCSEPEVSLFRFTGAESSRGSILLAGEEGKDSVEYKASGR